MPSCADAPHMTTYDDDVTSLRTTLSSALTVIHDHWRPVVVGEVNNCLVKLVKFRGKFCWHRHENEDEMFVVLYGAFRMLFRAGSVEVRQGEMLIVPHGTEHMPVADDEVHVLLVEPQSTVNTGDVVDVRTVTDLPRLSAEQRARRPLGDV